MININAKWRISAAAVVAAASVAACNNGGGITPPSGGAPTPPQTNDFSVIAERAFAANANSTPISLDGITFTFDVDNEPGAFDALIASSTFQ